MTEQEITEANITPACRSNRGVDGAWDEAVRALRFAYNDVLDGWKDAPQQPTINLVLTLTRPLGAPDEATRRQNELDLLAELTALAQQHHSVGRPSKHHDPETIEDFRACPCLSCQRVKCVEAVILAEGRVADAEKPDRIAFMEALENAEGAA